MTTDTLLLGDVMAKEEPPLDPSLERAEHQLESDTVRIDGELAELIRDIIRWEKKLNPKRKPVLKIGVYVSGALRPVVTRDHAELRQRVAQLERAADKRRK